MAKKKNPVDAPVTETAPEIESTVEALNEPVEAIEAPSATTVAEDVEQTAPEANKEETDTVVDAPVDPVEEVVPATPAEDPVYEDDENAVAEETAEVEVPANSSLLQFPTDIWGLTTDLKFAIIAVASRVGGQADKKELVDATLKIGLAHLEVKYKSDAEIRAKQLEEAIAKEAELETNTRSGY